MLYENIVGKGENANQHFLLFPQYFLTIQGQNTKNFIYKAFELLYVNLLNQDRSKILPCGKGILKSLIDFVWCFSLSQQYFNHIAAEANAPIHAFLEFLYCYSA